MKEQNEPDEIIPKLLLSRGTKLGTVIVILLKTHLLFLWTPNRPV